MIRYFVVFSLLCISVSGFAYCPYLVQIGPEVVYFRRIREGGTSQDGRVDGVRVGIDRIKPHGLYLGAEFLYAGGNLDGETGTGRQLKSRLTDQIFEARVGFTLEQNQTRCTFFTPFGGWGHFCEINDFFPPSPLPLKFTDTFNYIVVGFLSGVNFTPLLSMGLYFKVKFMQDGKSKVSEDPLFEDVSLMMKDEIQVRLDVPFNYFPCNSWFRIGFLLSPFYEFRHFGGREGFPFDFKDTKFHLYGARFALTYRF